MAATTPHLTILGGGLAGLSVGYFARRRGYPFTIYEAADRPGGNCVTHRHGAFRFDSGAHRFHDKDAAMTGELRRLLGADLARLVRPSLLFDRNRFLEYPLSPSNLVGHLGPATTALAAAEIAASRFRPARPPDSFADLTARKYGKTLARRFLLAQAEKIWNVPAGRLHPSVADKRFKEYGLRSLVRQLALGGNGTPRSGDESYYYPEGGIGTIARRMAASCGRARVRCRSSVTRVEHGRGRIRRIEINGAERPDVEEVVSTLPLDHLVEVLRPRPPGPVREAARRIRYRDVVLAAFFLDRPSVSPAATIYVPDPAFSIVRVYEPRNRNIRMAPPGRTSLVAEIPCERGGTVRPRIAEALIERARDELVRMSLVEGPEVLGARLGRMDRAYPVLEKSLAEEARKILAYLASFDNLKLSGRAATYQYVWMHELMAAGAAMIRDYAERFDA